VKEVLAVNDLPLKTMLQQFYRVIPADGYNRGYQRAVLAERFPYYYALYYGFPDTFEIRYRDTANDSVQTTAVAALSNAVLNRSNRPKPALDFELRREPPAAILRIGHFSYYTPDQEAYFRSYIDSVFQIIKDTGTRNQILDVRGNDGGNPFCAAWVLSYIEEEPVPYFDRPFGRYRILAEPVPLAMNAFDGELCILIDEKCFSTTGHFTALLKYHDIGTLIGSETGGTYTCNDAKKLVYLKNTRLVLQIARGTFAVAVANMDRGRGVSPDLSVPQDIHDLIQNKDTVLEYALKLLTD
jgi:hypothetical protein